MRHGRLSCAVALATLLLGRMAWAEPNDDARRLYAEGKAEYAQGHYERAVKFFERSYALFPSAALLFNMAQAHRLAGPAHCADASSLYKSYLQAEPHPENEREVRERIAQLEPCAARAAAAKSASAKQAAARAALQAPAAASARRGVPTGPVLVAGTGAALLVAGGVLYWRAWAKHREAERVCPCYPGTYANWEVLTNVSYALLAAGGATLGSGIGWWIAVTPRGRDAGASALVGVSGHF